MLAPIDVNRHRSNPESILSLPLKSPNKQSRAQIFSPVHSHSQLAIIHQRYQDLQKIYNQLVKQSRIKTEMQNKQKEQLEFYIREHQKDAKEIQRLTSILEIAKRNQVKKEPKIKMDRSSVGKVSRPFSSTPKQRKIQTQKNKFCDKKMKESRISKKTQNRSEECFNKYKFVPTLPLN